MLDSDYVLNSFRTLLMKITEVTKKPLENFDFSEHHYKRNMGNIAQIDVSIIFRNLTSICDQINELKVAVAIEKKAPMSQFDHQNLIQQFCDNYQDIVNIAGSIKICLDSRSGLLGLFKGYSNPIETVLSGKNYQLSFQQLRNKFSYHAAVLQQSEQKLLDAVAKDLDSFMMISFSSDHYL